MSRERKRTPVENDASDDYPQSILYVIHPFIPIIYRQVSHQLACHAAGLTFLLSVSYLFADTEIHDREIETDSTNGRILSLDIATDRDCRFYRVSCRVSVEQYELSMTKQMARVTSALAVWQQALAIVTILRISLVGWMYAYLTKARNYDPFDQNPKSLPCDERRAEGAGVRGRDTPELDFSRLYCQNMLQVRKSAFNETHVRVSLYTPRMLRTRTSLYRVYT